MRFKKPDIENDELLGINPFATSLIIPIKLLKLKSIYERASEDVIIEKEANLEAIPFIKLFQTSERRIIINNFSDRSQRLFIWLMFETTTGKDYVIINKERYMKENCVKAVNTISNAIKELLRYGIIANTYIKDVYWINPDFFFNGSRIKKYPNNIVRPKK